MEVAMVGYKLVIKGVPPEVAPELAKRMVGSTFQGKVKPLDELGYVFLEGAFPAASSKVVKAALNAWFLADLHQPEASPGSLLYWQVIPKPNI
jgi:uncharacterized protein YjeT (DUF2065 family)